MSPQNSNSLIFILGLLSLVMFIWYFATDKDGRRRWVGTLLSLMLIAAGTYWMVTRKLQKGIDLQGGVAYTISVVPNNLNEPVTDSAVNAAKEILERRLSPLGNKDVVITVVRSGSEPKLYVEVPGITPEESEKNRAIIEKVAKLDFRLVNEEGASLIQARSETEKVVEPGWIEVIDHQKETPRVDRNDAAAVAKAAEEKAAQAIANRGISSEEQKKSRVEKLFKERKTIVVQKKPELEGKCVDKAYALPEQGSADWQISVELKGEYGDKMKELTTANVGKPLAIVVDDEVISAPTIQSVFGGHFQITGNYDQNGAVELANTLLNPLSNPLRIDQVSNTSATYGEGLVAQGIRAGLLGLAATLVFMAFYYRLAGVIAVVGLAVNLLLLLAAMNIFEFTLTMPGIAGIILTLGIAVDANVLIYERMREEFATGKNLADSLDSSYSKAFTAIFDSNLTSLITSVIMIVVATGAIRGFGVTLTIGILCSLFSSLLITRVCFRWLVKAGIKKPNFKSLLKNRYIDFLAKRKMAFCISGTMMLFSIATLIIKGKESLGYELRGGDLVSVTGITEEEAGATLNGKTMKDGKPLISSLQTVKPLGEGQASVNIRGNFESGEIVKKELIAAYGNKVTIGDVQSVGPAVGGEMLGKAIWAIVLGLLGIFIYLVVRYETPFAIGGIAAIFHDVVIAAGLCALLGKEIGMILIGAYLTIAGYSINDTIVIFDRMRDQLKTDKGSIEHIMNDAISSTMSRTIITSGVTMLVVLTMWLFGGATLADFSLAMIIGIVVGTYSTIFVASPIVYIWSSKRKLNLAQSIQDAEVAKSIIGSGFEREVGKDAEILLPTAEEK